MLLDLAFPAKRNSKLIAITLLSVLSGFGGAFIIVVLNQAVQHDPAGWVEYFLFAIFASLYGGRVVRIKLTEISNRIVLEKRTSLIEKLLNASYEKIEKVDKGNIRVCLNHDTETISRFAGEAVSIIRNSVTLLVSLLYLATLNITALLVSVAVFGIAIAFYYITSRRAGKDWTKNRDIQNLFYKYIDDLIYGYKELSMKKAKRADFQNDILQSCQINFETRVRGENRFTNVFLIGELLTFSIIGMVIFIFPLLFVLEPAFLLSYLLIFLYINGQISSLLNSIPQVVMMRISWARIKETIEQIENIKVNEQEREDEIEAVPASIRLQLHDVGYEYENEEDTPFSIGPVNCEFRSGEITFITGGNGSGKSTLAKIITGLYTPHQGYVTFNGMPVSQKYLSEQFTAVFSDFYLFEKLYGVSYQEKKQQLDQYLKLLQIDTKLTVDHGKFSTVALSTGQRKRLALLISYMEDAPIILFDEWAADQDPEFRKFFYYELLPELRQRGKCVIAITHDEHYFHMADHHLKMEFGQLKLQVLEGVGAEGH
nr:cyclic peptide export ABC transporter [Paenibacillus oenotherae]